jgi:hypothetical protein
VVGGQKDLKKATTLPKRRFTRIPKRSLPNFSGFSLLLQGRHEKNNNFT